MALQERQLELVRQLMLLDPPVFLLGGYAEDAVLFGEVSRPHADIDVFVWRDEVELRLTQLAALGLGEVESRFEPLEGRPLVVAAMDGELEVELIVADGDERTAHFVVPGGDGTVRAWMPEDLLRHPVQRLAGIDVRTVSPLALHQIRAVSADLFGGFRSSDQVAQSALEQTCFAGVPAADLAPRVTA